MAPLINEDGSVRQRTTRGNRALGYNYTSIGEIVMTMEMMRASGPSVDPGMKERLHKAVDIFVRAVDDFGVIDPWAEQRHNSVNDGETQDWKRFGWENTGFGGSWMHVFVYRYPDHPNAQALAAKVPWQAGSATTDTDYGLPMGCIYNLASGRVEGG